MSHYACNLVANVGRKRNIKTKGPHWEGPGGTLNFLWLPLGAVLGRKRMCPPWRLPTAARTGATGLGWQHQEAGRPPGSGGGSSRSCAWQVLGSHHVLGAWQRKTNSCPQGASRLLCLLQKHGAHRGGERQADQGPRRDRGRLQVSSWGGCSAQAPLGRGHLTYDLERSTLRRAGTACRQGSPSRVPPTRRQS